MSNRLLALFTFVAAIPFLGGCGAAGTPTVLQGTWTTACSTSSGIGSSSKQSYVFNNNSYTLTVTGYSDAACGATSGATTVGTINGAGTISVGAAVTSLSGVAPAGATVDALTFTQSSLTVTPAATSFITQIEGFCPTLTSFAVGTTTNMSGAACSASSGSTNLLANGASYYDVFALSTTSLSFGQSGVLGAPATASDQGSSTYSWTTLEGATYTKQ